jgi:hypothetical protein
MKQFYQASDIQATNRLSIPNPKIRKPKPNQPVYILSQNIYNTQIKIKAIKE